MLLRRRKDAIGRRARVVGFGMSVRNFWRSGEFLFVDPLTLMFEGVVLLTI
jgi:hypothetical protein